MKLDKNYLIETIMKVLGESEDGEFDSLMKLASDKSEGSGIQALEMMFAFDLTEHQIRSLYNVALYNALEHNIEDLPEVLEMRPEEYTDKEMAVHRDMAYQAIAKKSETPERLLKAMNFDFHKEFTQVYGVTPPRDKEFSFEPAGLPWKQGDEIYLTIPTEGGLIVFSFFFEGLLEDHPSDPYIYLRNKDGDEIWMDIDAGGSLRYDTEEGEADLSKEEVPRLIRQHMGSDIPEWPGLPKSDSPIKEKLDRNYLFQLINEVLRENEDDMDIEKKINDFIDSKDLESIKSGLNLLDTLEMSGLVEEEESRRLKEKMLEGMIENNIVVDDVLGVYDLIEGEEFSSSFSPDEIRIMKSKVWASIILGGHLEKVTQAVVGPNIFVENHGGSKLMQIQQIKNQEFVEHVIDKFEQLSGKDDFAVLDRDDPPLIFIGENAKIIANYDKKAEQIFGFRPKEFPYIEIDGEEFSTEDGSKFKPMKVDSSPLFGNKPIEFKIITEWSDGLGWTLMIDFLEEKESRLGKYKQFDQTLFINKKSNDRYTLSLHNPVEELTGPARPDKANFIKTDGQIPIEGKDAMIARVKELTGIDLTNVTEINESVLEIEENFGAESRGEDLLQEGWKDQWPNEFGYLLGKITSSVKDKPDIFAEALVKIFYRLGDISYIMPIKFYRSARYKVKYYADKGIEEQKKKIDDLNKGIEYVKNEPAEYYTEEDRDKAIKELQMSLDTEQETLDKFEQFKSLIDDPFYFGYERKKQAQKQGRAARAANPKDKLPVMRVSNKLIKSIRKQLTKWRDKNVMNTEVYPYIGYALTDFTRSIQSQEDWAFEKTFDDDLATLIQFIKGLRGNQEDLGKKLMSIVNKGKDLNEAEFIEAINKFIDEGRQIEFVDCKDAGPNDPCVFLRLDDGMFWHSTSVDYCEMTQTKMANCGAASDPTGMLYNLMSNEGGVNKYHVTLEYSKSKDKVIQVLGKANTLPKEKYWSAITKFFDAVGNPILDKDAFMHMYNDVEDEITKDELDQKIQEFVEGIGVRMVPPPAIDSWKSMREQIRGGYYSDIVERQSEGFLQTNMFRAGIVHGRDDDNKAAMMLNIKMVMQTVSEEIFSTTPDNEIREMLREDRKKLDEYAKSGKLKKEILDFAVPEKYLDSQREIHLKYSRSSDVRIRMSVAGSIVAQVSFVFGVRTEPWTEARGEYLVENFNQLTKYTADKLERVGLSMVFDVAPERAAKIYPEEAKRLADVNDILNDLGLDEGKKKIKLDRNYLTSLILEVIEEEREFDFSEMITKDLDFEGLRSIIELLLDSEDIKYETVVGDDRVYYNFYQQPYQDYYWYQPFDALVDAFNKAGIQDQRKMRLMTRISTPSFKTITHRLDKRTIAIYDNSK